ncbi:MAG: DNA-binding protein [Syntrophus sp. (in: bacteria)]|nr:DNA-binding protein [Syntrophus sp. (in: bacteria)]
MTDKPNPCFIETNILVYAYSETEPEKKQIAVQLLMDRSICMSTQVVNEFIWIMSSKYRVDMKLLSDVAKNLFLLYRMDIIDDKTIAAAIDMSMRYRLSYWDSLIVSSAVKLNCPILYSEDLQHEQIIEKSITITNPFS